MNLSAFRFLGSPVADKISGATPTASRDGASLDGASLDGAMVEAPRSNTVASLPASLLPEAEVSAPEVNTQDVEGVVAVFRTLVLGMAVLLPHAFASPGAPPRSLLWLGLVAGLYNMLAAVATLYPSRLGLRRPLIIAMDTILVSAWIVLSGQFGLFPFYTVVVVLAGLWGRTFGALLTAAVCDFFYILAWANAASDPDRFVPFSTHMAISCVTLPLLGALVGYLSELSGRERERRLESQLLIANYEREIDLSRGLQKSLLGGTEARAFPDLDLGLAARMARTLGGGDFFEAMPVEGGGVMLCIADVSGKSARAQSRLPLLKYALRALAPLHATPQDLVSCLNRIIAPELTGELYIAACCVLLDAKRQRLEWCNAGHIAPMLIRRTEEKNSDAASAPPSCLLTTSGPPLGMFEDADYDGGELEWCEGDALLLFTDGLTDAFSYDNSEDGEAQLSALAARLGSSNAPAQADAERLLELANAILDSDDKAQPSSLLKRTTLDTVPLHRDDMTVAVARFRATKPTTA